MRWAVVKRARIDECVSRGSRRDASLGNEVGALPASIDAHRCLARVLHKSSGNDLTRERTRSCVACRRSATIAHRHPPARGCRAHRLYQHQRSTVPDPTG